MTFSFRVAYRGHDNYHGHDIDHPMRASQSDSQFELLVRSLQEQLAQGFRDSGWQVRGPFRAELNQFDLDLQRGPLRYCAEIKIAREPRKSILQALLADAMLRARCASKEEHARPLAVVGASRLSDALIDPMREYAEQFAPGDAWGVVDGRGRLELFGEGLEDIRRSVHVSRAKDPSPDKAFDPFSDLGQWMLKVLLAPRLPPEMLSAPRVPVRNARALAEAARVSVPSAARLVAHLRRQGFLEDSHGRLELVRVDELLHRWSRALARPLHELPARFILPGAEPKQRLEFHLQSYAFLNVAPFHPHSPPPYHGAVEWKAGPRACFGLHSASSALGFVHVHGAPVHLCLESAAPSDLELFQLVLARPGEAPHVFVRVPRFRESLFRAVVLRDHKPVADVLQCWLDLQHHPVRGAEAADELRRRVIDPWVIGNQAS